MSTKEVLRLLAELRYHQIMRRVNKNALRASTEKVHALIRQIEAEKAKKRKASIHLTHKEGEE